MKSIIAGILLSILQITATSTVRKAFMELFADITEEKHRIDIQVHQAVSKEHKEKEKEEKEKEEDTLDILPNRSDNLIVTFQDINNFQSVLTDKAYLCSARIQEIILDLMLKTTPSEPPAEAPNPIINILLSLFGVPKYQEEFEKTCPGQKGKSTLTFPDSIIERTLQTRIESVLSETREFPHINVTIEGQSTTKPDNKVTEASQVAQVAQANPVAPVAPFAPFAQPVYLVGQPVPVAPVPPVPTDEQIAVKIINSLQTHLNPPKFQQGRV